MKTVVIEGKDLLFTLFKLAFYIWIEMWNVRILLVAVKMVIAVGGYSTYLAVILVSAYGICSAYRGLKKTVARLAMDGLHAVSFAGVAPVQTWLPDFSTAGAVKKGEVEMNAAIALKTSKAAGVFRGIKVK